MKLSKKSVLIPIILMCLAISPIIGLGLSVKQVQAAVKPKLNKTSMTIPVGKLKKGVSWFNSDGGYEEAVALTVKNKQKGASYTFTSSDTKIVKISKNGGYLTGVKKGKATITCKESYNGKTTVVGTCKVTVKEAGLIDRGADVTLGSGLINVDYFDMYMIENIQLPYTLTYQNPDATYTVKSDSKDLTFTETKLTKEEEKNYISEKPYRYEAKKAGKYTLTVVETYNKKTRNVGKCTLTVHDVEVLRETNEIEVNERLNLFIPITYYKRDMQYEFVIDGYNASKPDKNIVKKEDDEYIVGLKPGKVKVKVYELSGKKRRYLCEFTVVVTKPD